MGALETLGASLWGGCSGRAGGCRALPVGWVNHGWVLYPRGRAGRHVGGMLTFSVSPRLVLGLLPVMSRTPGLAAVWRSLAWEYVVPDLPWLDETAVFPHSLPPEIVASLVGDLESESSGRCLSKALLAGASLDAVEVTLAGLPGLTEDAEAWAPEDHPSGDVWWALRMNPFVPATDRYRLSVEYDMKAPTAREVHEGRLNLAEGLPVACCLVPHAPTPAGGVVADVPHSVGEFTPSQRGALAAAAAGESILRPDTQESIELLLGPFLADRYGVSLDRWTLFFELAGTAPLQQVLALVDSVVGGES